MKTTMNITHPAFALFAFVCFALAPDVRAVCQQGCGINFSTFLGDGALISNITGVGNTAVGNTALMRNTGGSSNTATGYQALINNTTGSGNTANGYQALASNSTTSANSAFGNNALAFNNGGTSNTATGNFALNANTMGNTNTANGDQAMLFNKTGSANTAVGQFALEHNINGSSNIAVGSQAGFNLTLSNNIDIGALGNATDANTIRLGKPGTQTKTFIAGISGATVPGGVGVIVGSNGQLGTVVSSARFKEEIKPMDKASEAILALRPVTFHYKHDLDPEGIPQFGLVAEDVEKVNPNLVARDDQGKPYTVRYEAVNAMLLNEFLKEHRTVQDLKAVVVHQQKQIETLTTGLVKVSAELELSKPAPQTVLNNR